MEANISMQDKKIKLLTVEDEDVVRESIVGFFEDLDYDVIEAYDGLKGIEVCRQERPDIVLTDLRMPGMDGLHLVSTLATEFPNMPIIVVSGTGVVTDAIDAVREGAWDYVTKPIFDMQVLEHVVNKSLERAMLIEEKEHYQQHLETEVSKRTAELNNRTKELEEVNKRLLNEVDTRREAEDALRQSEKRFRMIFQMIPDAVSLHRMDGEVVDINESFLKMTNYTIVDIRGKKVQQLSIWGEDNGFEKILSILKEKISCQNVIMKLNINKEKKQDVLVSARTFHLGSTKYILVISKDVTKLRKAEEGRILLMTAVEQAAESIMVFDNQRNIKYANSAAVHSCGYSREILYKKGLDILAGSELGQKERWQQIFAIVDKQDTWNGRIKREKKSGGFYISEGSIASIKDKNQKITNYVAVTRDISREIALEQQLHHSQKMEAIGTLAGGIAHDFNNILNAVIGYAELSQDNAEKGSELNINLEEIINAAMRATDLIKQIMIFSRREEEEQTAVSIKTIVEETLKLLRGAIPSTIEIIADIQKCGYVMANTTQIHQVIMNLCTNAYHAMRTKGGVLKVSLNQIDRKNIKQAILLGLNREKYICLTISDTGKGMPAEIKERIFEPYFTTKEIGEGTGLGLATVHGILINHKGAICVDSEENVGTVFSVFLPIHEKTELDNNIDEDEQQQQLCTGKEHIMLIDDEEILLKVTKIGLERLGYKITPFLSSKEALNNFVANSNNYDMVITDQMMPELTGIELAKCILKIKPKMKIVLYSGYSEGVGKTIIKKISAFVKKPIKLQKLAQIIRNTFDKKK